jgi:outer membrane receptor for ferrienterochelin and colicins
LREDGHDAKGNLLLTRTNAAGAWVGGINIEGKVSYSPFVTLQLGYTYQQSRYTVPQQWSPDVAPQTRMLHTPDHYGYMLLDVKPIKDFTISVNGKVTGSMVVPHLAGYIDKDEEATTPTFWDFGIRLAYEIHLYKHYGLEVSCGVKNILDQFQRDLDKGPNRDASYIYGPTTPRTYFVGLALKL